MAYNFSLKSILALSSHLRLGVPKDVFPVDLPVNNLKAVLLLPFGLQALLSSSFYI